MLMRKTVKALNPFNAPGSLQAEQQRVRRERVKFVVWTIVVANVLLLMGLLIQGCKREPAGEGTAENSSSPTNTVVNAAPPVETNAPVPPTFESPSSNGVAQATATNAPPPAAQGPTKPYVVAKGDSFYKIAKANGISVKALTEANPSVDSARLRVGQTLQVPSSTEPQTAAHAKAPTHSHVSPASSSGRYVVKSGDTLARIARTHHTTVQAIKSLNSLTSDHIAVGRTLKLPTSKATVVASARA